MPNIAYIGGKPVDVTLHYDDFTNTMSEVLWKVLLVTVCAHTNYLYCVVES